MNKGTPLGVFYNGVLNGDAIRGPEADPHAYPRLDIIVDHCFVPAGNWERTVEKCWQNGGTVTQEWNR